jgi:hypothetical protein
MIYPLQEILLEMLGLFKLMVICMFGIPPQVCGITLDRLLDQRGRKEFKVNKVMLVQKDLKAYRVNKVFRAMLVQKDLKASKVSRAFKDQKVPKEFRALRVSRVLKE